VTWFADAGRVPRAAIAEECERVGVLLDRPRELTIETV